MMTSGVTIQIRGLDKLQRKVGRVSPAIKAGIKAAADHVHGIAKVYPPATIGNKPRQYVSGAQNTWYERGWGSKWALKGGGWHGNRSSQELTDSWTIKIKNRGMTAIVGNDTKYGPYVQDREKQTRVMKRIGWKTVQTIAEEEAPIIMRLMKRQVDKALGGP